MGVGRDLKGSDDVAKGSGVDEMSAVVMKIRWVLAGVLEAVMMWPMVLEFIYLW